eukprot:Nk52_evm68s226 gene=Nk52_evmTU68s226
MYVCLSDITKFFIKRLKEHGIGGVPEDVYVLEPSFHGKPVRVQRDFKEGKKKYVVSGYLTQYALRMDVAKTHYGVQGATVYEDVKVFL